ncbi:hypothetical protein HAX54_009185 [Datura stramonium]|uniref:Uncharacterized protein n=1 Tax=Datura stramonium TaxID=4076 RepID=A0ABS8TH31_DATST|nr:hypothetical protein [Datura stramonium]
MVSSMSIRNLGEVRWVMDERYLKAKFWKVIGKEEGSQLSSAAHGVGTGIASVGSPCYHSSQIIKNMAREGEGSKEEHMSMSLRERKVKARGRAPHCTPATAWSCIAPPRCKGRRIVLVI